MLNAGTLLRLAIAETAGRWVFRPPEKKPPPWKYRITASSTASWGLSHSALNPSSSTGVTVMPRGMRWRRPARASNCSAIASTFGCVIGMNRPTVRPNSQNVAYSMRECRLSRGGRVVAPVIATSGYPRYLNSRVTGGGRESEHTGIVPGAGTSAAASGVRSAGRAVSDRAESAGPLPSDHRRGEFRQRGVQVQQHALQVRHRPPAADDAEADLVVVAGQRDVDGLPVEADRRRIDPVQLRTVEVHRLPRAGHVGDHQVERWFGVVGDPRDGGQ